MTLQSIIVLVSLIGMLAILITDKMRPGMTLLSVVIIFLVAGILTPKEMLEGFSNKGMITVAMLFLISEGVRRSGALSAVVSKVLPNKKIPVRRAQLRLFPLIYSISLFINNTPLVVIFAPIIKRWAKV
ncbi:MAG: SLC13/DASS family transporter, partial [Bacteroidales bacterium]|nr:SLC13/DASS family transporter [Bacteroidales bacterium]